MSLQSKINKAILEDDIMNLRTKLDEIMNIDKTLKEAHSIYIRLKATDENGTGNCKCCGKPLTFKTMACGHFIKSRHLLYRWFEPNTEGICYECNGIEESDPLLEPMRDYKIRELGIEEVEQVERNVHKPFKMSSWDKDTLLKTRRLQIKSLLRDKNFTVNIP